MALTLERKSHPTFDHLCICFSLHPAPTIPDEADSGHQVRSHINFATESPGNRQFVEPGRADKVSGKMRTGAKNSSVAFSTPVGSTFSGV